MTVDASPLTADAAQLLPSMIELRRRLHRCPEIGLGLPLTQAIVVEALRDRGLEPRLGNRTTSATAVIEGEQPGPTILLRADMDALRVPEETGLDFASEIAGAMHACGHDTHVAMLMGATDILLARRRELAGRVLLMFQPGEEGYAGARVMLDEGLLDAAGSRPSNAFGLHISTRYPTRTINLRPGPLYAAADQVFITVTGRGGHASTPHLALDPVVVAAEVVLALQTIVTRKVDAADAAVVTIGQIQAGTATNVIPETARLGGTIRTLSEQVRAEVHEAITTLASGIAAAHGARADVEIVPGYPVTVNDPGFAGHVRELAWSLFGEDRVAEIPAPHMGAEDFSYVLQQVPGAMAFLGARPSGLDPATAPQNHSNRVIFDEAAMADGAALLAAVALAQRGGPASAA